MADPSGWPYVDGAVEKRHSRAMWVFATVFLLIQGLFLLWLYPFIVEASKWNCDEWPSSTVAECENQLKGVGLGMMPVLFFWFIADVALAFVGYRVYVSASGRGSRDTSISA